MILDAGGPDVGVLEGPFETRSLRPAGVGRGDAGDEDGQHDGHDGGRTNESELKSKQSYTQYLTRPKNQVKKIWTTKVYQLPTLLFKLLNNVNQSNYNFATNVITNYTI